ncbi:DHA2 family efflux MFS transporter permease subunit [Paenibacillus sp. IITD108]
MTTSAAQIVQVRKPKMMAFVFMFAAFIGLYSETALNMALTNIMSEFSVSEATVQWLTTGYLLTLGILVPISTLLIQWFTTKQLVITSLAFSIAGTILAALAPSFSLLLSGRIIQAVGTGILLPLMMNVILLIFPIQKRGAVMGIMGLVITTAPAVGPAAAGFIVDTWSWPYIFWISLIFYAALVIFGLRPIDNVSRITKPAIDVTSIACSTIGFGGLIYSLSNISEKSFLSAEVWIPFVIGALAIAIFIRRQIKMEVPMINLRVFQYRMFALGTLLVFLGMILILSTAILLPLYIKGSLLFSAAMAGIILVPGSAVNAMLSPIVGRLFDQFGARRFVPIGFLLTVISCICFLLSISDTAPVWKIIAACVILFMGIPMIIMPAQTNGLNQLPRSLYADGAAVMNTLQQIAGATGTAFAITLMVSGQNRFMNQNADFTSPELLAAGTKYAFIFIAVIAVIGFVSSLFVRRVRV